MKKQFVKGILAAALALSTIFSIPQSTRFSAPIQAEAACNHNYRHYCQRSTPWVKVAGTEEPGGNELTYYEEENLTYTYCINCGKDEGIQKHRRLVCEWDEYSRTGKKLAHHKKVVKVYY